MEMENELHCVNVKLFNLTFINEFSTRIYTVIVSTGLCLTLIDFHTCITSYHLTYRGALLMNVIFRLRTTHFCRHVRTAIMLNLH